MSQVLQVLEIFEIWIFQIFGYFFFPKLTSTHRKLQTERDGDVKNNKLYINITANLYPLVHVIISLYGY